MRNENLSKGGDRSFSISTAIPGLDKIMWKAIATKVSVRLTTLETVMLRREFCKDNNLSSLEVDLERGEIGLNSKTVFIKYDPITLEIIYCSGNVSRARFGHSGRLTETAEEAAEGLAILAGLMDLCVAEADKGCGFPGCSSGHKENYGYFTSIELAYQFLDPESKFISAMTTAKIDGINSCPLYSKRGESICWKGANYKVSVYNKSEELTKRKNANRDQMIPNVFNCYRIEFRLEKDRLADAFGYSSIKELDRINPYELENIFRSCLHTIRGVFVDEDGNPPIPNGKLKVFELILRCIKRSGDRVLLEQVILLLKQSSSIPRSTIDRMISRVRKCEGSIDRELYFHQTALLPQAKIELTRKSLNADYSPSRPPYIIKEKILGAIDEAVYRFSLNGPIYNIPHIPHYLTIQNSVSL